MEEKNFTKVTPEIECLAEKCRENNRISLDLYDKYEVKRGLRDLNGKGVLTGLTEISEVKSTETDVPNPRNESSSNWVSNPNQILDESYVCVAF